jgi:hypothetical protein
MSEGSAHSETKVLEIQSYTPVVAHDLMSLDCIASGFVFFPDFVQLTVSS